MFEPLAGWMPAGWLSAGFATRFESSLRFSSPLVCYVIVICAGLLISFPSINLPPSFEWGHTHTQTNTHTQHSSDGVNLLPASLEDGRRLVAADLLTSQASRNDDDQN